MKKLLIASLPLFVLSCNDNPAPSQAAPAEDSSKSTPAVTHARECFQGIANKDTVVLTVSRDGQIVTGSLSYRLDGKDKNDGMLSGKMNGDTLLADYTFMSEGQSSVRQVAFVREGSAMVEAFADVEDQQGKMVIKPGATFKLNTLKLQPLVCDSAKGK
jgi:hypothetical protein